MSKAFLLSIVFLVAVMTVGSVMASPPLTVISGIIYAADSSTPISGATVTVTCNSNIETTTSLLDGSYQVVYAVEDCAVGDTVTVSAVFNEMSGSNSGLVSWDGECIVNTGIFDVTIPEFGVIAGSVALLGAIGFVMYKRKN